MSQALQGQQVMTANDSYDSSALSLGQQCNEHGLALL